MMTTQLATKPIKILAVILGIQIILTVLLRIDFWAADPAKIVEPLIKLDPQTLSQITVEAAGKEKLLLHKRGDGWVLPQKYEFQASAEKVLALVKRVNEIARGYPVGQTQIAAKQFKVTDEVFEKKVTFANKDGSRAVLYIGSAPDFKKVHVRVNDEPLTYAASLNAFDIADEPGDWLNSAFLKINREEVKEIIFPQWTLVNHNNSFVLSDLLDVVEMKEEEVGHVLAQILELDFVDVLGIKEKTIQSKVPDLLFEIKRNSGEPVVYEITKLKKEDAYFLKVSNQPFVFKLAPGVVEDLLAIKKESMVQPRDTTVQP